MRGRIETIDVFRGLSILVVVLFHFTARVPPDSLNVSGYPLPAVFWGSVGVISGYCIFLTLEKAPSVLQFLIRHCC